jgi:uncharacterized protein YjbI with pentapeptide repeats
VARKSWKERWWAAREAALGAAAIVAGAVVAGLAVAVASSAVLALAGLLLLAAVAAAVLLARKRLRTPGPRVALVGGTAAIAIAILVPTSMNVDRCARLGQDADLSGCNLSDRDLASEDLRGADLSDADLSGTDLRRAELTGADLSGASLRRTNVSDARLGNADLSDADLREANLDSTVLTGADLGGARVTGATLTHASLAGASLTGLDLAGVDLRDATLDGADLSLADANHAHLGGADLSEADVSETDLSGADLAGASLDGANLRGARLVGASMTAASLDGADVRGADLSRADLTDVAAPGANFREATFTRAQLRSNDFVGAEGIADADLSAALEVPARSLAGATARRGVVLDRFEDIVRAVAPVRGGRAVRGVHSYRPSREFHPMIVLDTNDDTTPSWATDVQDQWAPTAIRYAELVAVVQPRTRETVEVCQYTFAGAPAPPITRYVESVEVRVMSAHDGRIVARRTFRGGDPRQCGATESLSLTEIEGDPPNLRGEARPWLAGLINPPAERA